MIPGFFSAAAASRGDIPYDPLASSILSKLTSWWEMTEASGVRADSHSSNDAAALGSVSTGLGVRGDTAANFQDGGILEVANSADIEPPPGGGAHCLFGWFYTTSNSGSRAFASRWNAVNSLGLSYYARVEGENVQFQNGGSSYQTASAPAPAVNQWHFMCGWRDPESGAVRVQVNAGAVYSSTGVSNPTPQTHPMRFGVSSSGGTHRLPGRLQRWGWIKGDILTPAERAWLYNGGVGRTYAEIVASANP